LATQESVLPLDRADAELFERQPNIIRRTPRNLYRFARRKPLGAFGAVLVAMLLFMAVFGAGITVPIVGLHIPSFAPYHYNEYQLGKHKLESPSASHIMGTDQLGRDVFSRLLYGARISFSIGLGVFGISAVLSTALTLVSGYYVTSVDLVLQRIVEIFHVLPELIILISLFAVYGATPLTLVLTLGILRGFQTSRVLRSLVIGVRGMPYIEATKSLGASDRRILYRHVLPNVFYLIVVSATAAVSGAIQAEAGLAIIGFGLDPTYPSWGVMLNNSREFLRVAPHLAVFPALFLAMTIFGFRLLGDALRDVLDPRLRGSR